jgi:hypothetical protein
VAGAHVVAYGLDGSIASAAVSGTIRLSLDPDTFQFGNIHRSVAIPDGRYALPVPHGLYHLGIEADDGFPAYEPVTFKHVIARIFGHDLFPEEYWSGPFESAHETLSGFSWPVLAWWNRRDIDFVVDAATPLVAVNADLIDQLGAGLDFFVRGLMIAVRVPSQDLLAVSGGGNLLVKSALVGVTPLFEEEAPRLTSVMVTTGALKGDGSVIIDVSNPLERERQFPIQSSELTPMHLARSRQIGALVTDVLAPAGRDLFVVVEFPHQEHPTFPGLGVSQIGAFYKTPTAAEPAVGETYVSSDGGVTWFRPPVDVYLGLVAERH